MDQEHVGTEELAAFLEGSLDLNARRVVTRHLDGCPRCRATATLAGGTLGEVERKRRRRIWVVPTIAAAAVAALLLVPWGGSERSEPSSPQRNQPSEGTPSVDVVTPTDQSEIEPDDIRFVWRSAGPGATYDLTITDREGVVVLTQPTADTVLFLPGTVTLVPGVRYFWFVDALLGDARSATTGFLEFRVRP
jgi:hypothetical protein